MPHNRPNLLSEFLVRLDLLYAKANPGKKLQIDVSEALVLNGKAVGLRVNADSTVTKTVLEAGVVIVYPTLKEQGC